MTEQKFLQGILDFTERADTLIHSLLSDYDERERKEKERSMAEYQSMDSEYKAGKEKLAIAESSELQDVAIKRERANRIMSNVRALDLKYKEIPVDVVREIQYGNMEPALKECEGYLSELSEIAQKGSVGKALKAKQIQSLYSNLLSLNGSVLSELQAEEARIRERFSHKRNELDRAYSKGRDAEAQRASSQLNGIVNGRDRAVNGIPAQLDIMAAEIFPQSYLDMLNAYANESDFGQIPMITNTPFTFGELVLDLSEYTEYDAVREALERRLVNYCDDGHVYIPQLMDITRTAGVLVIANDSSEEYAKSIMSQVNLKILENIEAGDVEFNIVDPFGKGRSLGILLSFNDKTNRIFPQIVSDEDSISKMLTDLENELLDIIQSRFKGRFENIMDFNKENPGSKIPIRVLDIYDFPYGFNRRAFTCLYDILLHSKGTGVVVNLHYNVNCGSSDALPNFSSLMGAYTKRYTFKGRYFTNVNELPLIVPEQPSDVRVFKFASDYIDFISDESKPKVDVTFRSVAGSMFAEKSFDKLALPLGVDGDGNVQKIILGSGLSHHMMITGATGSGKSSLLHAIIIESLYNYSPEQVNLYLMDFKSGIEFKMYDRLDLPHIKLLAVDAMQEFGESIFAEMCEEIDRRAQLFKEAGVESLSKYHQVTGRTLPRILVIIDEFQTLFDEHNNRSIAVKCADYADNIVMKGRSFGIHLIMSTQTLKVMTESISLRRTTVDQMRSRIGLHCSEEDCTGMFGQWADQAYKKMAGPVGTAVYMRDDLTEPDRFTVAYSNDQERLAILEEIAENSRKYKSTIQVFEGSKEYCLPDTYLFETDKAINISIGRPISVAPDIQVSFKRNYGGNTLIASNNEALGRNLESIIMRGILGLKDRDIYFFGTHIGEYVQECEDPSVTKVLDDKDTVSVIYNLSKIMDSRKENGEHKPTFLFISNLQWNRLMQDLLGGDRIMIPDYLPDLEDLDYSDANLSDHFSTILRNGGSYNIFTIVSTANCEQMLQGIRRSLVSFNNILGSGLNDSEIEALYGYGYHIKPGLALYTDRASSPKLFKVFKV